MELMQEGFTMNEYDLIIKECKTLMLSRNAKYGNSWKNARLSSLIDYVIMKYSRMNKLVDNVECNKVKIKSDLQDALNYCVFALAKLGGEQNVNENHKK